MKLIGIRCLKCGDIIYSRARHDFHYCSCGAIAIDGGFDYLKISGEDWVMEKDLEIPDVDETVLYKDWNTGKDKYGVIKNEKT
jgi:hypothetical protein